jgi:DNA polymerase/3'-5' exonuclease PolX
MSSGQLLPLSRAQDAAETLLALLEPACDRIAIAGSVRRRRPMVADIELVAMARVETVLGDDLWQTPEPFDHLAHTLDRLAAIGLLSPRQVAVHRSDGSVEHQTRQGTSYQALEYQGLPVDLFIVRPPADWGVILALRTGPGGWNVRLVSDCRRFGRRVAGGRLYQGGHPVPCPEERDFFEGIGQPWVEPEERTITRVRIQAEVGVPA